MVYDYRGGKQIAKINEGIKNECARWNPTKRRRKKKRKIERDDRPPRICAACVNRGDVAACAMRRCPFLKTADGSQIVFK